MPQGKIAGQEQLLPGASFEEKREFAQSAGFDGIELRARDDEAFGSRLGVLERAVDRGVVMPAVCLDGLPLVGDVDRGVDALRQEFSRLGVIAALGGQVVVVPVSDGRFLPVPCPRSSEEDYETLSDGLHRLAERAAREGVSICLQPVNRYEGHPLNTLNQATELCREVGLPSARVAVDTFHMNTEEADPPGALPAAGPWLGHVELADTNGLEPGVGHLDWSAAFSALGAAGYDGWAGFGCRLPGPAESVLPPSVSLLHEAGG